MIDRTRRFLDKWSSLVAIAPTRSAQTRMGAVTLWLWLRKRSGRRGGRLYHVTIVAAGSPIRIEVGDYTDLEVIREVFAGNIYAPPAGADPAVILDIGSNVGVSVKYFRSRFPQAEIHAVEPDHHSLVALRANTRDDPKVTVHPVAVGAQTGPRSFYMSRQGWASSLAGDRRNVGGHWVTVECCSLEDLLVRTGHARVDLLKIDAEGAEWELFATTELRRHADLVIGELHDRQQHSASDLLPGLSGLRLVFTDPPHDTCFVAERVTSGPGSPAPAGS